MILQHKLSIPELKHGTRVVKRFSGIKSCSKTHYLVKCVAKETFAERQEHIRVEINEFAEISFLNSVMNRLAFQSVRSPYTIEDPAGEVEYIARASESYPHTIENDDEKRADAIPSTEKLEHNQNEGG